VTPVLEISSVIKDYRGLRPLRLEHLVVAPGERIALVGIDQASAEVLINLITGTTLPDQGILRVFGQATADIKDSREWMTVVDRFGILSERAVLLEGLSALQNLSIPFSLEVEPPAAAVREKAEGLAREVGLAAQALPTLIAELDRTSRALVRLGRALALDPQMLLLEHPTATIPREHVKAFGRQVRDAVRRRGAAALALTADRAFARSFARRLFTFEPSTGRLVETSGVWFRRWLDG
jgi:molybdate transport system ATP-binding protein